MDFKTYSFADVTVSCNHTAVGSATSTGAAFGSISIAMAGDRTAHDIAADGHVMISKLPGPNGTITITVQQVSSLHEALIDWYNEIDGANSSKWASMTITIESKNLKEKITCTGVSPQKMADRGYEAQGGSVTWPLMAAKITHE